MHQAARHVRHHAGVDAVAAVCLAHRRLQHGRAVRDRHPLLSDPLSRPPLNLHEALQILREHSLLLRASPRAISMLRRHRQAALYRRGKIAQTGHESL